MEYINAALKNSRKCMGYIQFVSHYLSLDFNIKKILF